MGNEGGMSQVASSREGEEVDEAAAAEWRPLKLIWGRVVSCRSPWRTTFGQNTNILGDRHHDALGNSEDTRLSLKTRRSITSTRGIYHELITPILGHIRPTIPQCSKHHLFRRPRRPLTRSAVAYSLPLSSKIDVPRSWDCEVSPSNILHPSPVARYGSSYRHSSVMDWEMQAPVEGRMARRARVKREAAMLTRSA